MATNGAGPDVEQFRRFFKVATKHEPFPFQERFGTDALIPDIVEIPTGLGKTGAVVLGWLWRRRFEAREDVRSKTPRRLVYCLPVRTLVEQTEENVRHWLGNLGMLAQRPGDEDAVEGWASSVGDTGSRISITILMGGEDPDEWDRHPDREAIIIGTQDMLLSRALCRGYGMSRFRWPVHFGLLNNDCLWVMDEVQLMGVGVETTAQLQAFRESFGCLGPASSIWMSATVGDSQLDTVDHPRPAGDWRRLDISTEDQDNRVVEDRMGARKRLTPAGVRLGGETTGEDYTREVVDLVLDRHVHGTLTLVIANVVPRVQEIFTELLARGRNHEDTAVLHSRFRRFDRASGMAILQGDGDRIVVATQVVEAGVDVSARTLVTELAPWPSMVQRFGRCNRYGEYEEARIEWIDIETEQESEGLSAPYEPSELEIARHLIENITDGGPRTVSSIEFIPPARIRPTIRRKDLLDLFDTTPDLSGNDLDVSRYVREGEDMDVQVFWRELPSEGPSEPMSVIRPVELCSVSMAGIDGYLSKSPAWTWDPLDGRWLSIRRGRGENTPRPGQVLLLSARNGGYSPLLGWTGPTAGKVNAVSVVPPEEGRTENESMDDDPETRVDEWVELGKHLREVSKEALKLADGLMVPLDLKGAIGTAGMWHDIGKAHPAFQNMLTSACKGDLKPPGDGPWAKSAGCASRGSYSVLSENGKHIPRPYFRHELASSLAWFDAGDEGHRQRDLIGYLIVAHHGKVRLSIRSLPQENEPPDPEILFARGIWHGDVVPPLEDLLQEGAFLDLSSILLGEGSWLDRTLRLRDDPDLGPFRLALLESVLRIADWRVSSRSMEES